MPLVLFALQVTNKNPFLVDKGTFSPAETRQRFIQVYKRIIICKFEEQMIEQPENRPCWPFLSRAFCVFFFCLFFGTGMHPFTHNNTHTHNISHSDIAQHRSWRWLLTYPWHHTPVCKPTVLDRSSRVS